MKASAVREMEHPAAFRSRSGAGAIRAVRVLLHHPRGLAGVLIVGLLLLMAIFAPVLSWHSPNGQFRGSRLIAPSSNFIFGTDEFSRDIWARVLYGLRTTLLIAFSSVFVGAAIGSLLGFVGGFVGGPVDAVLSRLTDALLAFPAVVMAIAVATALGRGSQSVAIALAIFNIPLFARLARGATLVERRREYVQAARSVGAGGPRLLFLHVVPNTMAPLFVQVAFSVSFSVLLEAGLSFLGLGTAPPGSSIGGMLNSSRIYMRNAVWYPIYPGAVLVLLLIGMNFMADAINDLSDPRRRRR